MKEITIRVDWKRMQELAESGKLSFEWQGYEITNPLCDETGRFPVEPGTYYGAPFVAALLRHDLIEDTASEE